MIFGFLSAAESKVNVHLYIGLAGWPVCWSSRLFRWPVYIGMKMLSDSRFGSTKALTPGSLR